MTSSRTSSRPTLEQVAALAGVSRGTASRVLSGASNVSESAVEAVRLAIPELGAVNIPAGTYTVSCWTESCEPQRRDQKSIKITAKETTALDFSFGPRK